MCCNNSQSNTEHDNAENSDNNVLRTNKNGMREPPRSNNGQQMKPRLRRGITTTRTIAVASKSMENR